MSVIERQIILTLAYCQQFEYPLSVRELWLRLLQPQKGVGLISAKAFSEAVAKLVRGGLVSSQGAYLFLSGAKNLVETREKRSKTSQKKRQELSPLLWLCRWLPWVAGVAITGSLAMNNADEKADADVMIVTENNRLWLVRPMLVLFSFLFGKRRSWNKEEENSWCLNLWLERESLAISQKQRSVYTAYEVLQADWVISKDHVAAEFYQVNAWITQYLWTAPVLSVPNSWSWVPVPILTELLSELNKLSYLLQRWYMSAHMTKERVTLHLAFFHPRDTRNLIVTSWRKVINTATISPYDHFKK